MKEKEQEKLGEALLKVALGFQVAEVTEEYAEVDGQLKLTKRKRTKKDVPPDLKAMQLLLSSQEQAEYSTMTEEELIAEKNRLLAALKEEEAWQVFDEVKKEQVKKPRPKPRKRVIRKK